MSVVGRYAVVTPYASDATEQLNHAKFIGSGAVQGAYNQMSKHKRGDRAARYLQRTDARQ